jgi:hypothetical protein
MKNKRTLLFGVSFGLALTWLVATIFIDFVAVPAVFSTITSRDDAAELGIKIFTRFNYIEIAVAVLLLVLSRGRKLIAASSLVLFPILYISLLSPNIDRLNNDKINLLDEDPKMEKVQEDLDFYHNFYVKADSVKILLLILMMTLQVRGLNKEENI